MSFLYSILEWFTGLKLIVVAGIAMYITSKALSDALGGGRTDSPGRLAVAQWLPTAVLAVAAVAGNRPAIAMGLIFSSSIACLCLGTGAVALLGFPPAPSSARRAGTLLLPAALLASLAGFQGAISLGIAGLFSLQGLVVILLWTDPANKTTGLTASAASDLPLKRQARYGGKNLFRVLQFIIALALAWVGAWLALHGVDQVSSGSEFASAGLLTATILSPLLVLPIIGNGTELSQRNQSATAVDSQMGVVLLNICALLPIVVFTSYARTSAIYLSSIVTQRMHQPSTGTTLPAAIEFHAMPFPLGVWRVDVVMLIALGLLLMPVALGRWALSKQQGLAMMVGYAVYLFLAIEYQRYILYGVPLKSSP